MHVIVLVKQVPDPKQPVGLTPEGTIERGKAKNVMNPYDKHALEAALQIKDKVGAKVTVISMGPPQAKEVVMEALAMGADKGILISDLKLPGSDTLATSYTLSKAIKNVGDYDLILCGMETTDGNTGQVGPEVAEFLHIPHISYVEEFKIDGKEIEAKRLVEGGYERLKTKLPALLTVTNTANEPRYPTVLGIVRASKKAIATWTVADLEVDESKVGLRGSPTTVKKIDKPKAKVGECVIFEEDEVEDFLKKLREDGVSLVCKR